jgi:hypothetical protein
LVEVAIVANGRAAVVEGCGVVLALGLKSLLCAILDRGKDVDLIEEIVNGRNRADQRRIKHESKMNSWK